MVLSIRRHRMAQLRELTGPKAAVPWWRKPVLNSPALDFNILAPVLGGESREGRDCIWLILSQCQWHE